MKTYHVKKVVGGLYSNPEGWVRVEDITARWHFITGDKTLEVVFRNQYTCFIDLVQRYDYKKIAFYSREELPYSFVFGYFSSPRSLYESARFFLMIN